MIVIPYTCAKFGSFLRAPTMNGDLKQRLYLKRDAWVVAYMLLFNGTRNVDNLIREVDSSYLVVMVQTTAGQDL